MADFSSKTRGLSEILTKRAVTIFLGMVAGYLILHPYTMLAHSLSQIHQDGMVRFQWSDFVQDIIPFRPKMASMAVPFVLFGGLTGLLANIVLERKRRLLDSELENEKRKIALETLRAIMVTLSHHLLNANMIIGGRVRHCQKRVSDAEILVALSIIEEQGHRIDAVVKSLREVTEVQITSYTSSDQVKMIDIAKEIERRLKGSQREILDASSPNPPSDSGITFGTGGFLGGEA
jgi:signal transduction histidine kinase